VVNGLVTVETTVVVVAALGEGLKLKGTNRRPFGLTKVVLKGVMTPVVRSKVPTSGLPLKR
jgi:hypothetical protein